MGIIIQHLQRGINSPLVIIDFPATADQTFQGNGAGIVARRPQRATIKPGGLCVLPGGMAFVTAGDELLQRQVTGLAHDGLRFPCLGELKSRQPGV